MSRDASYLPKRAAILQKTVATMWVTPDSNHPSGINGTCVPKSTAVAEAVIHAAKTHNKKKGNALNSFVEALMCSSGYPLTSDMVGDWVDNECSVTCAGGTQTVDRQVEVPQIQIVDKIIEVPQIQ